MVVTGSAAAHDPAGVQHSVDNSWLALPAISLPIVILIAASASIGFSRIGDPPATMLELLEALLPSATRPAASPGLTLLGPLVELEQSRALTSAGASLLVPVILQAVTCAAAFASVARRSTSLMGLVAALALGCNPAWLLLLKQAPGTAAGLLVALLVLALVNTARPLPARSAAIAAAVCASLFAAATGWSSDGVANATALLLLVGGSLGPFLGILALASWSGGSWKAKAMAMGPLALSLVALLLAITAPTSPQRRQIEANQAELVAQRAFQDLLRPFVRRAGRVVIWDQTVRTPRLGPVTVLPRRYDISPDELSYALRHDNLRVLMVIACAEPSECSAAQLGLDAIGFATAVLLQGGRLSIGGKVLHYIVVEHLPVRRQ